MVIYVLEGSAKVTALDEWVFAPAGTRVRIEIDGARTATGTPVGPEPYDDAYLSRLPTQAMERDVEITESLTEEEIEIQRDNTVPLSGSWTWTFQSGSMRCPEPYTQYDSDDPPGRSGVQNLVIDEFGESIRYIFDDGVGGGIERSSPGVYMYGYSAPYGGGGVMFFQVISPTEMVHVRRGTIALMPERVLCNTYGLSTWRM